MENKLIYKEPKQLDRDEILRIFSVGSNHEICDALLSVALYDEDWKWSQDQCLHFLNHSDPDVRCMAVIGLRHIVRIHRQLDLERVINSLKNCLQDEKIAGEVQDSIDDIQWLKKDEIPNIR